MGFSSVLFRGDRSTATALCLLNACWPITGPSMSSNGVSAWSPLASVPAVAPICLKSSG